MFFPDRAVDQGSCFGGQSNASRTPYATRTAVAAHLAREDCDGDALIDRMTDPMTDEARITASPMSLFKSGAVPG